MRSTPRALWAGVWGSASALILVACAWLARAPWPNGTELDAYQPAPLRWPGWLGSFPPPSAAPAPKMRRTAAVGVPKDWRDNINYGYHPDEAKVPEDEEQEAMQALLGAAGGGSVLPAGDVLGKAQHQTRRSARVPQARVAASAGATEQLVKVLAPCEDMPGQPCAVFDVPPKKPRGVGLQQLPQTSQYPCESHPSDLRCSEYPAGQLTPEFDKARFGRGEYGIKVTNGAIRNVEGNAADTDGRRRSAPESQFQYTMRSLSSKYENQEPAQRRDGYHGRIDVEDPMGQLQTQKLKPVHSYQTAKYGPGVGVFSLRQVGHVQPPRLSLAPSAGVGDSASWKATYGPYGIHRFHVGDSDDTMGLDPYSPVPGAARIGIIVREADVAAGLLDRGQRSHVEALQMSVACPVIAARAEENENLSCSASF